MKTRFRFWKWLWRTNCCIFGIILPIPEDLTLSLLMSYICGAPCKARHFNVVYIWTYVWQRWKPSLSICCAMFQHWINAGSYPVSQLCVNTLPDNKVTLITGGILFDTLRVKHMYDKSSAFPVATPNSLCLALNARGVVVTYFFLLRRELHSHFI
jgi:hypothetical protein